MPLHKETRLGTRTETGSKVSEGTTTEVIVTHAADYVAQLRHRSAESLRCPPLDCGLRDPWRYPPPSGPRVLEASRDAWCHLYDLGLLDNDGWLAGVLAEGVAR